MAPDTHLSPIGPARGMPALVVRLPAGATAPEIAYAGTGRVARLLVGREPSEVEPLLGRVFAICPAAQQLAARLALAAAKDAAGEVAALVARARAEALREHTLRVLLGWSAALGEAIDRDLAARVNRETRGGALDEVLSAIEGAVFGGPAAGWLADEGLDAWAARGATVAARFVSHALDDARVPSAAMPPSGTLVERHAAHVALAGRDPGGAAAFHAARLADLARLLAGASCASQAQATGPGAAQVTVECSRGALTHRARLAKGRVADYEIVSPTDRAFADDGFARQWLGAVGTLPEQAREHAVREIVSALDPCTETRVEFD